MDRTQVQPWVHAPVPGGLIVAGQDAEAAIRGCSSGISGHAATADPPLRLQDRLNDILGPAAHAQPHRIGCSAAEQAQLLEPVHHCHPHLENTTQPVSRDDSSAACRLLARHV